VVCLAGIAGAISYSHMRQLAQDHGQAGWHAHAFPLSVDGIDIVASLVLLADRRAGRPSRTLPWAALMIGTAGSLAANVATAGPGVIGRIIAGWPAVALLIAVKLLSGMLDHRTASCPAAFPPRSAGDPNTTDPSFPVPDPNPFPQTQHPHAADHRCSARTAPRHHGTRSATDPEPSAVPDLRAVADLLPAARAARDGLHSDGHRLTRDALAARLLENGRPVRNSRLTLLLQALRNETTAPSPSRTDAAAEY
jgi:hypothetical protein